MRALLTYSGLLIVLLFAGVRLWFWFDSRRKPQFGSFRFDEEVSLTRRQGLVVADLWLELVPRQGQLIGVAKLLNKGNFSEPVEKPLAEFPLSIGRYRVTSHGGRTVSVHEIPCRDEDFYNSAPDCIPLADRYFRGIKLAAPSRVRFAGGLSQPVDPQRRPPAVPTAPLVGRYMIDSAVFGNRDVSADDIHIVITNQRTGMIKQTTLAQIRQDYQERGIGNQPIVNPNPTARRGITLSPEQLEKRAAGSKFAVDIGLYLTAPDGPETYEIRAECAGYRSPVVRLIVDR